MNIDQGTRNFDLLISDFKFRLPDCGSQAGISGFNRTL